MLAVCLWIITVCIDARRAFDTLTALRCLPHGSESDIRVDGISRIVIAQISYARLVACVLVQLLRLVIGAILLWFGSLYLIHTFFCAASLVAFFAARRVRQTPTPLAGSK